MKKKKADRGEGKRETGDIGCRKRTLVKGFVNCMTEI